MRYSALITLLLFLGLALFLAEQNLLSIAWFASPVAIPLLIEILYLKGRVRTRAISITGIVVLALAIPVYISDFTYTGTDAQAGLGTAIMPIYQLVILLVASMFVGILRFLKNE